MCHGMPPYPWDVCGGAPGGGLVGFLWGTPKVDGGSRSWPFRDGSRRQIRAEPAWLAGS
jgi:hypothetical protein